MKTLDTLNHNEQLSTETTEQSSQNVGRKASLNLKVRTRVGMPAQTQVQAGAGVLSIISMVTKTGADCPT
jgi:hypothetical protein